MFAKMKLRQRILLGYLIPFLLLLAVMVVVSLTLHTADHESRKLNATASFTPDVMAAGDSLVRMQRAAYAYLLINGQESVAGGYPKKIFDASETRFQSLVETLSKQMAGGEHQDSLRRLSELGKSISSVNRHYMALIDAGEEKQALADFRRGESIKLASRIDPLVDELVKSDMERRAQERDAVTQAMATVQSTVIIGTIAAVVLTAVLGLWVAAAISRRISENASQLSAAANQIAATIAQHERTASQQAAAASETSATIQELSVSSKRSSEQAANAAALAEQSGAATMQGGDATRQAVASMTGLKGTIGAMADQILRLGEQTSQIGNISALVKDLSSQINMLALNAAVEAARAGEHGKGFAVVASEVRKLADESKKSAEQAGALVADIQKTANASILMAEESSSTVAEVTRLSSRVGELFESLAGMAGGVNENAQQVMLNARQQSAAFGQVVDATNSIASGAKETAAGIGQTKVGVQALNQAAENLKAMA